MYGTICINKDVSSSMPVLSATSLYKHFSLMREEILKHKWFESERAGKDVGFEYALMDWVFKFKQAWDKKTKDLS
jgi:hypothetical protein